MTKQRHINEMVQISMEFPLIMQFECRCAFVNGRQNVHFRVMKFCEIDKATKNSLVAWNTTKKKKEFIVSFGLFIQAVHWLCLSSMQGKINTHKRETTKIMNGRTNERKNEGRKKIALEIREEEAVDAFLYDVIFVAWPSTCWHAVHVWLRCICMLVLVQVRYYNGRIPGMCCVSTETIILFTTIFKCLEIAHTIFVLVQFTQQMDSFQLSSLFGRECLFRERCHRKSVNENFISRKWHCSLLRHHTEFEKVTPNDAIENAMHNACKVDSRAIIMCSSGWVGGMRFINKQSKPLWIISNASGVADDALWLVRLVGWISSTTNWTSIRWMIGVVKSILEEINVRWKLENRIMAGNINAKKKASWLIAH